MDTDPQPDADPFPHGGPFFLAVYDAGGEPLARGNATVLRHTGSVGLGPTYAVRFVDDGAVEPRRFVLPVRAEPVSFPLPEPEPLPDAYVHSHRHAHHGRDGDWLARTGLVVERYDHTHAHAHPAARIPDDRTYHDDHRH